MIVMENGANIVLEASWALNTLQEGTGLVTLCGTEGGADLWDGVRLNGERHGKLYTSRIELEEKGVQFYGGVEETPAEREARMWIEAILRDEEPVVRPEQALVVSEILDAIYKSAYSGQAVCLGR